MDVLPGIGGDLSLSGSLSASAVTAKGRPGREKGLLPPTTIWLPQPPPFPPLMILDEC